MTFGQRLEKLRTNKNHTRDELAEYIGVSSKVIYNIEKDISEPNLMIIIKVCERYKVTSDFMIFGE